MGAFDEALAYWRKQRETLLEDIHDIQSGHVQHSQKCGSEWVDITQDLLREHQGELADVERLISVYAKRS